MAKPRARKGATKDRADHAKVVEVITIIGKTFAVAAKDRYASRQTRSKMRFYARVAKLLAKTVREGDRTPESIARLKDVWKRVDELQAEPRPTVKTECGMVLEDELLMARGNFDTLRLLEAIQEVGESAVSKEVYWSLRDRLDRLYLMARHVIDGEPLEIDMQPGETLPGLARETAKLVAGGGRKRFADILLTLRCLTNLDPAGLGDKARKSRGQAADRPQTF